MQLTVRRADYHMAAESRFAALVVATSRSLVDFVQVK